jgi:hypothetical protein
MSSNNANTATDTFYVFLCHNSEDKPEVRRIADELIKRGVKPWLDERDILPGTLWQTALEEQIANIKAAAIFLGESGIGPWQNLEIRSFITEFVERRCIIIPVFLPYVKCNGLINQDTSKDRFIMSLEVKYEQSNQTKKT